MYCTDRGSRQVPIVAVAVVVVEVVSVVVYIT